MSQYDVQIALGMPGELEAFVSAAVGDAKTLFPNSIRAIQGLAQAAQERWINYASGKLALPDGRTLHRNTGSYAESIRIEVDYPGGETLVSYVVYSDDPKAEWIENGVPAWDMHKVLNTSHKVRISKEGKKYLIIPFRWGTPGSLAVGAYVGREMPRPVYTWWLEPTRQNSLITGTFQEKSVQDNQTWVDRNIYNWGDRLTREDIEELGLDPDDGMGKNMVGMVRFRNRENTSLGSQYINFRVLSEANPKGWRNTGYEGYKIGEAVHQFVLEHYPALMNEALNADVERIKKLAGA
jgi:hypothetical protein